MEQNVFLGAGKGEWCMSPLFIGLLAIVLLVVFGGFWRNVLQGRFSFSTREWGFKSLSFASLGLGTVLIFFTVGAGAGGFSAAAVGGCVLWYWGGFLWAGGEVPGGVRGGTGSGA